MPYSASNGMSSATSMNGTRAISLVVTVTAGGGVMEFAYQVMRNKNPPLGVVAAEDVDVTEV